MVFVKIELEFYNRLIIVYSLYSLKFWFIQTVVLMWAVETPVPIPNTEVKHNPVDDTGLIKAGKVD